MALWNIYPADRPVIERRIELMAPRLAGFSVDEVDEAIERCAMTCSRFPQLSDVVGEITAIRRERRDVEPPAPAPALPNDHGVRHRFSDRGLEQVAADVRAMEHSPERFGPFAGVLADLGRAILRENGGGDDGA